MFTLFQLNKQKPFSQSQCDAIYDMLGKYSISPEGLWLQQISWHKVDFYWCERMDLDNGILGCFTPMYSNAVFLMPQPNPIPKTVKRHYWIQSLFDTVIHELRHMYQYRRHPVIYTLCSLPCIRRFTIELDARRCQEQAALFKNTYIRIQDIFEQSSYS